MADTSIEALEAETAGSWVRTVKDLTAGAAGGVAQVLLGMSICRVVEGGDEKRVTVVGARLREPGGRIGGGLA